MSEPHFGVSTYLFQDARLTREHLVHIAAHDFPCIELVTTRTHFDYRDEQAVRDLAEWLSDTGLALHAVHAPVFEAMRGRTGIGAYSLASGDAQRRTAALDEALAALALARQVPFQALVVHLGVPAADAAPGENQRDAARRSAEALVRAAEPLGVQVAFEVLGNALSSADALVRLIEDDLEDIGGSICLDYGHAQLAGDVADVIESAAGHIVTTHVHDNDGRRDSHLMPYAGRIDWDAAMTATQKVGYDGVFMLEVAESGDPAHVLARAVKARQRLANALITF